MSFDQIGMYKSEFFVLRSPLLPYSEVQDFFQKLRSQSLVDALRQKFCNKELQEAIYLASPLVYERMLLFLSGELKKEDEDSVAKTLFKYLLRGSARATPYGIFGSCSVGQFGPSGSYEFNSRICRDVKLDISVIHKLVDTILNTQIRKNLKYVVNNTIYPFGKDFRYSEYVNDNLSYGFFRVVNLKKNKAISCLVQSIDCLTPYQDLVARIIALGYPDNEASEFIDSLISSQFLLCELEFSSADLVLEKLVDVVGRAGDDSRYRILTEISLQLGAADDIRIDAYKEILRKLDQLKFGFDSNKFLHVSSFRNKNDVKINERVKEDILEAVRVFDGIDFKSSTSLDELIDQFNERFENQTVPLLSLFDPDFGIDFRQSGDQVSKELNSNDAQLMNRLAILTEGLSSESKSFNLANLSGINEAKSRGLPKSFSVVAELFEKSSETMVSIKYVSHGSSANLLTRFAAVSTEIRNKVKTLTDMEDETDRSVLHAEITYLPRSRAANVAIRPPLRSYELPILSGSAKSNNIIALDDLYVRLIDKRFVLLSKSLNKEVVPHLTTAFNHRQPGLHPIFRFLAELKYQGATGYRSWSWGSLSGYKVLPRIFYKNVVVSPMTWNLSLLDWQNALNSAESFRSLRVKYEIPNRVLLVDMDNLLPLDLSLDSCIDVMKSFLKKNGKAKLFEDLNFVWRPKFISEGEHYACEIVVPFINAKVIVRNEFRMQKHEIVGIQQRRFFPGSKWLYLKFYMSRHSSDSFLRIVVYKLISRFKRLGYIDKWFFVRYSDPEHHLRIRLSLKKVAHTSKVLSSFSRCLNEHPCVWRFQIDTYQRELDRYGGIQSIEITEQLFSIESDFLVEVFRLAQSSRRYSNDFYLFAGILWTDCLVNLFLPDLIKKQSFYDSAMEKQWLILQTTGNRKAINKKLDDDFRRLRREVESILKFSPQGEIDRNLEKLRKLVVFQISKMSNDLDRLSRDFIGIEYLNSLTHMFVNRLFNEDQLHQEYRIYYYLSKYYYSANARDKALIR